MAADEQEFTHESYQDRESIARYLTALREGLQNGKLLLASNGERFALEPATLVKFDVEARQNRERARLVLKLSWKRQKPGRQLRVEPLLIDGQAPRE
ncbi:MAG: amphi-Trp domain-containing protein [Phycisphaerales bacterium]|nr:amphi-Trp domain-containing protein [Phycisphaerales bacterium]